MTRKEREGFIWIMLAAAGFFVMPTMFKLAYLHSTFAPMDIAIWRFVLAAPIMMALVLLRGRSTRSDFGQSLPTARLLFIGAIISAAVQRIGAAQASLVSTVEPIMSMVISMLILGEMIFALHWLGAVLIVGSVIALQLRPRTRIDLSIAHEAG